MRNNKKQRKNRELKKTKTFTTPERAHMHISTEGGWDKGELFEP